MLVWPLRLTIIRGGHLAEQLDGTKEICINNELVLFGGSGLLMLKYHLLFRSEYTLWTCCFILGTKQVPFIIKVYRLRIGRGKLNAKKTITYDDVT